MKNITPQGGHKYNHGRISILKWLKSLCGMMALFWVRFHFQGNCKGKIHLDNPKDAKLSVTKANPRYRENKERKKKEKKKIIFIRPINFWPKQQQHKKAPENIMLVCQYDNREIITRICQDHSWEVKCNYWRTPSEISFPGQTTCQCNFHDILQGKGNPENRE